MKRGDIICFKGKGLVFKVLSFILGLLNKDWRKLEWKPWHMAYVDTDAGGYVGIVESVGSGVRRVVLQPCQLGEHRVYRWFDETPDQSEISKFTTEHIGFNYDIAIYFWTTLAVIIRHFFNHPIPKLLDRQFSCWELVQSFTEAMGKPIASRYDVVIITDMVKALEGKQILVKGR